MLDFWLCQTNNAEWEEGKKEGRKDGRRLGASSIDVSFRLTNVLFMYVFYFLFFLKRKV